MACDDAPDYVPVLLDPSVIVGRPLREMIYGDSGTSVPGPLDGFPPDDAAGVAPTETVEDF